MKQQLIKISRLLVALSISILLGVSITTIAGENPFHIIEILFNSAFGSPYDFGMTLSYSIPLTLTGLSVAVAFRCGLFNIGAEGQLIWGAMGATIAGIYIPAENQFIAVTIGFVFAWTFGALWGAIAGILKSTRGCHEVITTIMLNFIAQGLTAWLTLDIIKDRSSPSPESEAIQSTYKITPFAYFDDAPVSYLGLAVLLISVVVFVLLKFWRKGYYLEAVGLSPSVAFDNGVPVKASIIGAMTMAGGLAGLVGIHEVLVQSERFRVDFSNGFGFTGIAVALVAKGNPLGVLPAAFLFAVLHKGSMDLDFETQSINQDLALLLQAVIVIVLAIEASVGSIQKKKQDLPKEITNDQ